MDRMHLDFETASDVDLAEVGLLNYLHHPSTHVVLAAWDIDGTLKQRDFEQGFDDLLADIDRVRTVHAWNAPFEWGVLTILLKHPVPLGKMRCTMAHALYRAFPGSLDEAARALGLPGKLPEGTRLLNTFANAKHKARPGDWEKFCLYNRLDVEAEKAVAQVLVHHPWPPAERAVWMMGEEINWRGVPVDLPLARAAVEVHEALCDEALAEVKQITGAKNPNSGPQVKAWLASVGVRTASLDKKAVPALLARPDLPEPARRVLTLRQRLALSAPAKFAVAVRQAFRDRMHSMLQYSGAGRTHRWSGRGLQPQNMRRGMKSDLSIAVAVEALLLPIPAAERAHLMHLLFDNPFEVLADLVRAIIHDPDFPLAVADYSSIEVVMLHWAAGDKAMLQRLRDGLDPYKVYAERHFSIPYASVTKDQRTFSKPVVLGCGYGLGKDTLVEYAAGMGVTMSVEEAATAVFTYRYSNPKVISLWYGLQNAMIATIRSGKAHRFGHFKFSMRDRACIMHLPAGTEITYWNAEVDPIDERITYEGVNQYTGQWGRISTWGGKLVENAVQSISRDVLVYGLQRAREAGVEVVLHVHDEIVALASNEAVLPTLLRCMSPPEWCADAPIHAAGFVAPRYRKD